MDVIIVVILSSATLNIHGIISFQTRRRVGATERGPNDQDSQAQLSAPHGQDGAEKNQPTLPTTILLAKTAAATATTAAAAAAAAAESKEGADPGTKVGRALLTSGLLLPRRRDGTGEDLLTSEVTAASEVKPGLGFEHCCDLVTHSSV